MARYIISTRYLTTTRGVNGSDEVPGLGGEVERATWPAAAEAFRAAVFDVTAAQGLRDRQAGWDAKRSADIATAAPMKLRDHDRIVNVGGAHGIRVRLRRVA